MIRRTPQSSATEARGLPEFRPEVGSEPALAAVCGRFHAD